ncbi:hypothetical protein KTT_39920 [Tengunoibacter tsumagoiensis]|uniref:Uncharacterized protein n=1 Tax=Tengunoibacter tsumagoiensis TaxID=2014871 RepID=A0A402A4R2_9CHLR|nr:hypothetical protein KTT_39920 [Tengunoibacter tsumagoiensis]
MHNCGGEGSWIKNLPQDPEKLLEQGWEDVTHPQAKLSGNSTEFFDPATGRRVKCDQGAPGNGEVSIEKRALY